MNKFNLLLAAIAISVAYAPYAYCNNKPTESPYISSHLTSTIPFEVTYFNRIRSGNKLVRAIRYNSEATPPPFFDIEYLRIPGIDLLVDKRSITGVSVIYKDESKKLPNQTFYLDFLKSQSVEITNIELTKEKVTFVVYFIGDGINTATADAKCSIDITKPLIPEPICTPLNDY